MKDISRFMKQKMLLVSGVAAVVTLMFLNINVHRTLEGNNDDFVNLHLLKNIALASSENWGCSGKDSDYSCLFDRELICCEEETYGYIGERWY